MLVSDRFFDPDPAKKSIAIELYTTIKDLPIISPHGHVDPSLFSSPDARFGNPVEELIQPDHYIVRMLVSQGVSPEALLQKDNPRQVWQLFADHFHLYLGTPSGLWMTQTLEINFGITDPLNSATAQPIYDQVESVLADPDFNPRSQFEKMRIEVLSTTDPVTSALEYHKAIRASDWQGKVVPTFRADDMINLHTPDWGQNIHQLSESSGVDIKDFPSFISALEQRRAYFKSLGATATDTSVPQPNTGSLSEKDAEAIFQRALKGQASAADAALFSAHMLMELARMSVEDGLVMQLHSGVYRNHSPLIYEHFGPDMGFDIPVRAEFTHQLKPLLDRFGFQKGFSLILFTLDESVYTRELAPLAGAYPAVRLGPPWWFFDSWNGMSRYFDAVMETAGIYNTSGFNDDTRSFLSIPARHDVWRRASANWLAGLLIRHLIDQDAAEQMAFELAVGLTKRAYHL